MTHCVNAVIHTTKCLKVCSARSSPLGLEICPSFGLPGMYTSTGQLLCGHKGRKTGEPQECKAAATAAAAAGAARGAQVFMHAGQVPYFPRARVEAPLDGYICEFAERYARHRNTWPLLRDPVLALRLPSTSKTLTTHARPVHQLLTSTQLPWCRRQCACPRTEGIPPSSSRFASIRGNAPDAGSAPRIIAPLTSAHGRHRGRLAVVAAARVRATATSRMGGGQRAHQSVALGGLKVALGEGP